MNTNQKTRLKAEDMEWNVLKTLGLSKEQLEADGSMERLLQGMETEAIPLKFRTPVIDLSMDATLRLVPGPGTSHRNHRKIKEIIFLIINHLSISYFLYFCHILPIFRYSVHF